MIGKVDALGRALLDLQVSPDINQEPTAITAWVDTAFNGELVVPRSIINKEAIEVIANEGATPLLGIGLLDGHRLVVDYRRHGLELE
jgi:predicted aspartyl protease